MISEYETLVSSVSRECLDFPELEAELQRVKSDENTDDARALFIVVAELEFAVTELEFDSRRERRVSGMTLR